MVDLVIVMGDMVVAVVVVVLLVAMGVAMMAALAVDMEVVVVVVAPSMGAEGAMVVQGVVDTILMRDRMSYKEEFLGL